MKKRVAEKVISRSILALAVYPKRTMASALKRRPRFWTQSKVSDSAALEPAHKRIRLKFGEDDTDARFTVTWDPGALDPIDPDRTAETKSPGAGQ